MGPGAPRALEGRPVHLAGVLDAVASPAGVLRIEFDRQIAEEAALRIEVQKIGVRNIQVDKQATPANATPAKATDTCGTKDGKEHDHDHEHGGIFGENTELIFAAICGGLLLIGWLLSWSSVSTWIPFGCYLAAYFFGGYFTFREAIENIRAGRFEIDFLMLVAAIGAATLGEWAEGALLLFLFSIGHALENYAMGRAKRAIEALAELAPQTAVVRREGKTDEVPVEQLALGDVVIVKPNERLPADGFVVKGEGSINQAPITGESVPVDKRAVDDPQKAAANPEQLDPQFRAFAGTIGSARTTPIRPRTPLRAGAGWSVSTAV